MVVEEADFVLGLAEGFLIVHSSFSSLTRSNFLVGVELDQLLEALEDEDDESTIYVYHNQIQFTVILRLILVKYRSLEMYHNVTGGRCLGGGSLLLGSCGDGRFLSEFFLSFLCLCNV